MRRTLLLLMLSLLFTSPAWAVEYFVAKTGSDANACTSGSPCLTINHGLTKLVSGDTLTIKAGTYAESICPGCGFSAVPSGGGDSTRTIIRGAPGETVVLRPNVSGGAIIAFQSESYITLENLVLDGANNTSHYGIDLVETTFPAAANRFRVRDVEMKGLARMGARLFGHPNGAGGGFHEFIRVKLHDSGSVFVSGSPAEGFYVTTDNNLFDGIEVYNFGEVGGYALQIYNGAGATMSNNTIRNSSFHHNVGGGVAILYTNNTIVENSLFYNNGSGALGVTSTNVNVTLRNNTSYGHTGEYGNGIVVNATGAGAINLINNIAHGNSQAGIIIYSGGVVTVQNNLSSAQPGGTCIDVNGNSGPSGTNACTGSSATGNLFGNIDPLFVAAGSGDFHLQSSSPAIDSGQTVAALTTDKDGAARPQGNAYDIGAYEFGSAPPTNELLSHWNLEEGTGTLAADSGPQDKDGTLVNGPTWVTGQIGSFALQFDGVNDYVDIPAIPGLAGLSKATLAGWVFRSVAGTTVGFGQHLGPYRFSVLWFSDNKVYFAAENGSASFPSFTSTATGWHHLAMVYNGTRAGLSRLTVYFDGVAQSLTAGGAAPTTALPSGTSQSAFRLGMDTNTGTQRFFAGRIDDVRIYNYTLTAAEVSNLASVTPAFDFTVGTDGNKTMSQGGTVDSIITVQKIAGTAAAVTPSVLSGLPSGVTAGFVPTTCTPTSGSCTSTMTLTATAGATTGTTAVIVRGTASATVRDAPSFNLTVNPTVAGVTFTQGKARVGTAEFATQRWQRPPNINGTIIPGGRVAVAIQVGGAGGDPPAAIFDLWVSKNGGAYALAPDTCAATNACLALGTLSHGTVINGRLLPTVESVFVAGYVVSRAPTTSIDLSNGSETNLLYYVGVGADVVAGTDTFRLRIHRRTGQALDTYSSGADVLLSVVKPGRFIVSGPAFSKE